MGTVFPGGAQSGCHIPRLPRRPVLRRVALQDARLRPGQFLAGHGPRSDHESMTPVEGRLGQCEGTLRAQGLPGLEARTAEDELMRPFLLAC